MAFCHEHSRWDQNPWHIPVRASQTGLFQMGVPPWAPTCSDMYGRMSHANSGFNFLNFKSLLMNFEWKDMNIAKAKYRLLPRLNYCMIHHWSTATRLFEILGVLFTGSVQFICSRLHLIIWLLFNTNRIVNIGYKTLLTWLIPPFLLPTLENGGNFLQGFFLAS